MQIVVVFGDSHLPLSCAVTQNIPDAIQLGPPPVQLVAPPAQLYRKVLVALVVVVVSTVPGAFGPYIVMVVPVAAPAGPLPPIPLLELQVMDGTKLQVAPTVTEFES